jgi:hypothetical protein
MDCALFAGMMVGLPLSSPLGCVRWLTSILTQIGQRLQGCVADHHSGSAIAPDHARDRAGTRVPTEFGRSDQPMLCRICGL